MKTFFQEFDHGFYRFPLSWGDVSQNARMAELVYSKALTYGLTLYQKIFFSIFIFPILFKLYNASKNGVCLFKNQRVSINSFFDNILLFYTH